MPTFGQNFLQGFTEVNSLRDYTHASKVFTTNAYQLKPRFKFLFHVVFTINVWQIPALRKVGLFGDPDIETLSLAVKTVDLPKYTINTETLNQYNRKRIVQTKINYDPVSITFHDDGDDNIRNMWYQYYSYYYKDPAQKYNGISVTNGNVGDITNYQTGMDYNARDIYNSERVSNVNDWGFIGESYTDGTSTSTGKPPFFRDIQIYGFDQHKYARYVLINPIITNWSHDQYDYSQGGGVMQNSMTIAYETVKYYSGALGNPDRNVDWPIKTHYDTTRSPISRPGSTASVFGQGGLLSTGAGILKDLEQGDTMGLIGAAQKAGTAYNTWKGKNLKSVVAAEATVLGKQVIQGSLPGAVKTVANRADSVFFPTTATARNFSAARAIDEANGGG